jgi:hypothetical protein
VPEGGAGSSNDSGAGASVEGGTDSASNDGSPTALPDGGGCDGDGTITEAEIPLQVGLRATYLDAQNVTWSTAGTADAGGLVWDLTGSLSGDQPVVFSTESPTGTWWTGSFGTASYASLLSASASLLGVFQVGTSALSLVGVVSETSGTTQTELTYATPIPTLQFPLSVGATWSATSNVTGQADGIETLYSESYVSKVDEAGTMKTPLGTYNVLRVGTVLTRTVGVTPTVTRSYAFVAECVGVVASVTSQSGEQSAEFSSDAEVKRLSP